MGLCGSKKENVKFTAEELEAVKKVWDSLLQNGQNSGLFFFEHFFKIYPDQRAKFSFIHDQYGHIEPEYMETIAMRNHTMKFMNILGDLLNQVLSRDKRVKQDLFNLGYTHHERGLKEDDVLQLEYAVIDGIHDHLVTDVHERAWRKVFQLIRIHFNDGLRKAAKDEEKASKKNGAKQSGRKESGGKESGGKESGIKLSGSTSSEARIENRQLGAVTA